MRLINSFVEMIYRNVYFIIAMTCINSSTAIYVSGIFTVLNIKSFVAVETVLCLFSSIIALFLECLSKYSARLSAIIKK